MSENLSFNPITPLITTEQHPVHSSWRFRIHRPVCLCLMFSISDDESPVKTSDPHLQLCSIPDSSPLHGRAEPPLPVQNLMNYHHTSTPSTDDSFHDATGEEDFPTAPLDDAIWLEDQFWIDTYVFMSSHSHIASVLTPSHTCWTCHIPLQKMQQHPAMRWWTSVTSSISKM